MLGSGCPARVAEREPSQADYQVSRLEGRGGCLGLGVGLHDPPQAGGLFPRVAGLSLGFFVSGLRSMIV